MTGAVQFICPKCTELELIRSNWIDRYMDLIRQRKALLVQGRLPSLDLSKSLAWAESELEQARIQLAEHSAGHFSAA